MFLLLLAPTLTLMLDDSQLVLPVDEDAGSSFGLSYLCVIGVVHPTVYRGWFVAVRSFSPILC